MRRIIKPKNTQIDLQKFSNDINTFLRQELKQFIKPDKVPLSSKTPLPTTNAPSVISFARVQASLAKKIMAEIGKWISKRYPKLLALRLHFTHVLGLLTLICIPLFSLSPIPENLVEKIRDGEYINFDSLLSSSVLLFP